MALNNRQAMSGILHVHTTYSSDGRLTVPQLRDYCLDLGLSFACITDHAEDVSTSQFDSLTRDCDAATDDRFTALPGLEFSVNGAHVLAFGLRHAPRSLIEAKEYGALLVLAHPMRGGRDIGPDLLEILDGVEVWNGGYDGGFVPDPDVLKLYRRLEARKNDLLRFGGCDLHDPEQRGIVRTILPADTNRADIMSTLAAGRCEIQGLVWRLRDDGIPFGLSAAHGAYTSAKRLRAFLRMPAAIWRQA